MITLPSTAQTDLFASVGTLVGDLWVWIAMCIGIPLAFVIIERLISMARPDPTDAAADAEIEKTKKLIN